MGSARELDPFDHGPAHVALDARKLCLLDHRLRRMMSSARKLDSFDHGAHREMTVNGCNREGAPICAKEKTRQGGGWENLAPRVGLEPTTTRLTAAGSTIELSRNM